MAPGCDSGVRAGVEGIQCAWLRVLDLLDESESAMSLHSEIDPALLHFSRTAQDVMSSTSGNYDVTRLNLGLCVSGLAVLISLPGTYKLVSRFRHAGAFLMFSVLAYGGMMFASSYVEEEQQFWYWVFTGWVFYLHTRSFGMQYISPGPASRGYRSFALLLGSSLVLTITYRLIRRWNQTGQKFSAEPDIAKDFFLSRPNVLWLLIILTYADTCRRLLLSMPASVIWCFETVAVTFIAFIFKLNFAASDSPELLSDSILGSLGNLNMSLVSQARLTFCGIALLMICPIFVKTRTPTSLGRQRSKWPSSLVT